MTIKEKLLKQQQRLKIKEVAIKARIAKIEAREKAAERKKDTRRKILLGAFTLKKMQELPAFRNELTKELNGFLKKTMDRALFDLSDEEEKHKQNA